MPDTPRDLPLLVFADDWGRHPSSCQHLIRRLLGRHPVYWVNTIGLRSPRLNSATLQRGLEKLRQWTWKSDNGQAVQALPRPLVLNPRMWPWFRSRFDRGLNRRLLEWQMIPLLRQLPQPPVAVTTIPIVVDLIGRLPVTRWVYYCVDDFSVWPGLDRGTLRQLESELISRAHTLIAVSETLRNRLAAAGREVHLLPHGVDLAHWVNGAVLPPTILAGVERPLIVFWGIVDRRMDVAFVRRLADRLSRGTVLLVGPQDNPDPRLFDSSRVLSRPAIPYEQLPALAREADVLIMPYADLPVTQAMNPLKLKEYLATGKPTVVRNLPAVQPWADCLDAAGTAEAFAEAVQRRLAEGLPAEQRQARARLSIEDWESKAAQFEKWILG